MTKPDLGGAVALATALRDPGTDDGSPRPEVPPIQGPLAAGLGGLAGLMALAWRHGTWARLWVEVAQRTGWRRTTAIDEGEDESYTLAP